MKGDHRGGIVWHTQGAGKSYTMVFFANKLRRDERFANPTVVAVTDRTDLDDQLARTFSATHLRSFCKRAKEIAGGPGKPARAAAVCRRVGSCSRPSRSSRRRRARRCPSCPSART